MHRVEFSIIQLSLSFIRIIKYNDVNASVEGPKACTVPHHGCPQTWTRIGTCIFLKKNKKNDKYAIPFQKKDIIRISGNFHKT